MTLQIRLRRSLIGLFAIAWLSCTAFAGDAHDRTQFGHNITIGPGEQAEEVTCFGCSVRVRGKVASDVTTFGGSVVIEDQGQVGGDTTVFGGSVRLEKGAAVKDVTIFGGDVHRDPQASVAGDVTSFSGGGWLVLIFGLPLVLFGAFIALVVWLVRMAIRPRVPATA